jgi:HEAT repeat protein
MYFIIVLALANQACHEIARFFCSPCVRHTIDHNDFASATFFFKGDRLIMRQFLSPAIVAIMLGGLAIAADVPALVKQLKSSNPEDRREAATALGKMSSDAKPAVGALVTALGDQDKFVRRFAAQALGEIGPDAKGGVKGLSVVLAKPNESKEVQQAAAIALGHIGTDGLPALIGALKDKKLDPSVRSKAAEGLGLLGSGAGSAVPELTKALGDTEVRMAAIGALSQMGPTAKESQKALSAIAEDKKNRRDKALLGAVKDALKKVKG